MLAGARGRKGRQGASMHILAEDRLFVRALQLQSTSGAAPATGVTDK
jgi:hypothetical protein